MSNRSRRPWPALLVFLVFLSLWFSPGAMAQPDTEATASVTPEILEAKIRELESTADLDEATKARLNELYRKALSNLATTNAHQAAADAFEHARKSAPLQTKKIQQQLHRWEKSPRRAKLDVSDKTPLAELERRLTKEKANFAAVDAKLHSLEGELAMQNERASSIRQRLSELKQRQNDILKLLKLPTPQGEPREVTKARRWMLETESLATNAEIRMLDQELLSQPVRLELLRAEIEKAAADVEYVGQFVKLLEDQANQRRLQEAEKVDLAAEAKQREAAGKHSLLQQVAEENARLSTELRSLASDLDRITAEEAAARKTAKEIEEDFQNAKRRLEIAGLSQALGHILQEQRRALPDLRAIREKSERLEQLIVESSLRQIRHKELLGYLRDIETHVTELLKDLPEEESREIREELSILLRTRHELLKTAISTDDAYLRALAELDLAQRHLLQIVEAYDAFLNQRLLWVRSTPAMDFEDLTTLPRELGSLFSPTAWTEVLQTLRRQASGSPVLTLALLIFGVMQWKSKKLYTLLEETGKWVGRVTKDRLSNSFKALALTFMIAAPWPILLAAISYELGASFRWTLGSTLETANFSQTVGIALMWVASRLLFFTAFEELCAPNGLAAIHFQWPQQTLTLLRRQIFRLMITLLPVGFFTLISILLEPGTMGGTLGKVGFVVMLMTFAAFFYRIFHPDCGVFAGYLRENPSSLAGKFRYVWFPATILVPVLLAGLSVAGFLFTAGTLTSRLIESMWLILVLIVAHQLGIRWLLLARRRLAFRAALERREAARQASETKDTAESPATEAILDVEEPSIDLDALSEDSRKLLRATVILVGIVILWFTWAPVLPALGVINDIPLWYSSGTTEDGTRTAVTLGDATLAVVIAFITWLAAKRVPAFMEIAMLPHFQMTAGGRYTTTTLTGYLIVAVGVVWIFSTLGVSWSQIQWLVAALGVGIGFGLQEIVANFISGLIILFERPIRVGDIVTIGDTDGVVTRIQIRATTIRNWDRKELLVPNKEFITGRLLNWSLSDQVTRILITVGVAYGSDVPQALTLMKEAAKENDHVMADPEPMTTFEGFGDNALALVLRCFVSEVDYRLSTISALHQAINHKFNDAGIVIAFPQRDVHLSADRPLEVRIHPDQGDPAADSTDS